MQSQLAEVCVFCAPRFFVKQKRRMMETLPIYKSRSFMTMILDVIVSLLTYFIPLYVAPAIATQALFVIGALQPIYIALIVRFTVEDAQLIKAGFYKTKAGLVQLKK